MNPRNKLFVSILAALGVLVIFGFVILRPNLQSHKHQTKISKGSTMDGTVQKTDKEWKETLTPEQYYIMREKGTERPFTGKYWNFDGDGVYRCAACGAVLFDSKTKFDAGCGWPSFSDVANSKNVILKDDYSHGMHRIEVLCAHCGGHLGHVFDDGPKPTGQRYCINSEAIEFQKRNK